MSAFIATGHSNTTSEGVNRMIKLCARNTHGFRNPANQRLRTRCVTTRRARGHLAPLNFVDPDFRVGHAGGSRLWRVRHRRTRGTGTRWR
ncbi:transposase [Streptomyces sp. M2CJ-2]|uniref:transposase n=1 Tax=Streptomyces sp. M2CJ-2 TaxID=2803948 RepID=UPI0034D6EE05